MKYDLIIIGSGSVGAAAGYYATRAGLNVLMIDAHMPPHQQGSHHGDTRLIRHAYGEGEKYVPLVLRAQTLWDELAQHNEEPVFVRSGVVNLGPANSGSYLTWRKAQNSGSSTLNSWMPLPSWPAGPKFVSRKTISACLRPIQVFCAVSWPLRPGFAWLRKQAALSCLNARLPRFTIMMMA